MTNGHPTPAFRPMRLNADPPEHKPFPDLVKAYADFWREERERDRSKELKPTPPKKETP